MSDDPFTGPDWEEFVDHVLGDMAPKLRRSINFLTLVPDDRRGDVKFWVELGAAIMMNKPIIAISFTDDPIPEKLRLVADEILSFDKSKLNDPQTAEAIAVAIRRMMGTNRGNVST